MSGFTFVVSCPVTFCGLHDTADEQILLVELAANETAAHQLCPQPADTGNSCICLSGIKRKRDSPVINEQNPNHPQVLGSSKKKKKLDDNFFDEIFQSIWWWSCSLPSNKASFKSRKVCARLIY